MAAEQLPTVVISAENLLYPIPATVNRANIASVRVKMMGMQEYPRPVLIPINGPPKGSNVASLSKNIDCEVSQ